MGLFRTKKQKQISKLQKQLATQQLKLKTQERRLYEATRVLRPGVRQTAPNQRNNWEAEELRDEARFLYQNDPIARRVVDSIVSNMVGKGITPIVRSETPAQETEVEQLFNYWTMTTNGDFYQDNNLAGMQALIVKTLVRDGAVFVRRVVRNRELSLQIMEHDYLDTHKNENVFQQNKGNMVINGIEYDRNSKVVAYWLYERHPGDITNSPLNKYRQRNTPFSQGGNAPYKSIRVQAKEICHIKRIDRPGQQDGESWLAPAIIKLWQLKEYEEAKLEQQKLQASFTAFIKDNFAMSEDERFNLIGTDDEFELGGKAVTPGHIEELPPGKDVSFPNSAQTGNEMFVERCLRSIAGAMGVSYEIFNDYSKVTYSSGRMGFLEMDRYLKHILKTVIEPQFLTPLNEWIINHLIINSKLPMENDVTIEWASPAREMIDPQKEVASLAAMVANNFISMREAHAILGKDFDQTINDIQKSNDKLAAVGLSKLLSVQGGAAAEEVILPPEVPPSEDETETTDPVE